LQQTKAMKLKKNNKLKKKQQNILKKVNKRFKKILKPKKANLKSRIWTTVSEQQILFSINSKKFQHAH
jgi:hypothetical protein